MLHGESSWRRQGIPYASTKEDDAPNTKKAAMLLGAIYVEPAANRARGVVAEWSALDEWRRDETLRKLLNRMARARHFPYTSS
jgi:hypothetical protein